MGASTGGPWLPPALCQEPAGTAVPPPPPGKAAPSPPWPGHPPGLGWQQWTPKPYIWGGITPPNKDTAPSQPHPGSLRRGGGTGTPSPPLPKKKTPSPPWAGATRCPSHGRVTPTSRFIRAALDGEGRRAQPTARDGGGGAAWRGEGGAQLAGLWVLGAPQLWGGGWRSPASAAYGGGGRGFGEGYIQCSCLGGCPHRGVGVGGGGHSSRAGWRWSCWPCCCVSGGISPRWAPASPRRRGSCRTRPAGTGAGLGGGGRAGMGLGGG